MGLGLRCLTGASREVRQIAYPVDPWGDRHMSSSYKRLGQRNELDLFAEVVANLQSSEWDRCLECEWLKNRRNEWAYESANGINGTNGRNGMNKWNTWNEWNEWNEKQE